VQLRRHTDALATQTCVTSTQQWPLQYNMVQTRATRMHLLPTTYSETIPRVDERNVNASIINEPYIHINVHILSCTHVKRNESAPTNGTELHTPDSSRTCPGSSLPGSLPTPATPCKSPKYVNTSPPHHPPSPPFTPLHPSHPSPLMLNCLDMNLVMYGPSGI